MDNIEKKYLKGSAVENIIVEKYIPEIKSYYVAIKNEKEENKEERCNIFSLELKCQHTQDKPRCPLIIKEGSKIHTFGVVPSEDNLKHTEKKTASFLSVSQSYQPQESFDAVELSIKNAPCDKKKHPFWKITNLDQKTSRILPTSTKKTTLDIPSWVVDKRIPWLPKIIPRKYSIIVASCSNQLQVEIESYPCNKLEIELDISLLWDIISGIMKDGFTKFLTTKAKECFSSVIESFQNTGKTLKGQRKILLKKAKQAEKKQAKKPLGKYLPKKRVDGYDLSLTGTWTAFWKEYKDYRAYYDYSLSIDASATGTWEWQFSLISLLPGMSWYQYIPEKYKKELLDCCLFFAIIMELSLGGEVSHHSPDPPLFKKGGINLQASPQIQIGGKVVIANGSVIKASLYGSIGLNIIGTCGVDSQGWYVEGLCNWSALKANFEYILFDNTCFKISPKSCEHIVFPESGPLQFRFPKKI